MPEDYEKFILWTLRPRNSRKRLGMLERNWKHQWHPLCLARHARKVRKGTPVARLMISSQNLHVSWKPVNPQGCVWKKLYRITMRTILQEKGDNSLQHYKFGSQIYSYASSHEDSRSKSSSGQGMGKLEKIPAWDLTKVGSKSEVTEDARTKGAKVQFASLMDICHLKTAEFGGEAPKIQRSSCTPRRYCER